MAAAALAVAAFSRDLMRIQRRWMTHQAQHQQQQNCAQLLQRWLCVLLPRMAAAPQCHSLWCAAALPSGTQQVLPLQRLPHITLLMRFLQQQ
jgi:hypothetical protein